MISGPDVSRVEPPELLTGNPRVLASYIPPADRVPQDGYPDWFWMACQCRKLQMEARFHWVSVAGCEPPGRRWLSGYPHADISVSLRRAARDLAARLARE